MMHLKPIWNALVVAVCFTVATLSSTVVFGTSESDDHKNLLEIMTNDPNFSMMLYLIKTAHAEALFQDLFNQSMVFVPTDNAFLDVRTDLMIHLLADQSWELHLSNFLKHHIVRRRVDVFSITCGSATSFETLSDEIVAIESFHDGRIIVDSVAQVVKENVLASNGVMHVIDNVLLPSWYENSIADLLQNDAIRFSTLVSMGSKSLDFMDALTSSSWEPYTIFAPTNEAFSVSETFDDESTSYIDNLLRYHIVPGIHTGASLTQTRNLESSIGQVLDVKVDSDQRTIRINGNLIIRSNILANNGIMHIVDGLLIPTPNETRNNSDVSVGDSVGLPIEAQTEESSTDGAEPSCACTSGSSATKNCEECDEIEHPSQPIANTAASLLRDREYDECLFSKLIEENRGTSDVRCRCGPPPGGDDDTAFAVRITCREGDDDDGGDDDAICRPKNAECDVSEECCSNPWRKCKGGKCRDARRPQRTKLGSIHRRHRETISF